MTKAKHTPGPWHVDPKAPEESFFEDVNVLRHDGLAVSVCVQNGDITPEEAEANARLVSAAPELLEAMIGIEHFSDALNFRNDTLSTAMRQWVDAGRAAIAKATGTSA